MGRLEELHDSSRAVLRPAWQWGSRVTLLLGFAGIFWATQKRLPDPRRSSQGVEVFFLGVGASILINAMPLFSRVAWGRIVDPSIQADVAKRRLRIHVFWQVGAIAIFILVGLFFRLSYR